MLASAPDTILPSMKTAQADLSGSVIGVRLRCGLQRDPQSLRLAQRFIEFPGRLRISHNSGARLNMSNALLNQHRADHNIHLHLPSIADPPKSAGVKPTADRFQLFDDL